MTTESDEKQQSEEKTKLTARQRRFIPVLISCATFTEACEKGRLNRTTLYKWLKDPEFKREVDRQREEVAQEAMGLLSNNLTRAVEVLAGLLEDNDKRLRRFAAKDVVEYFLKHKELREVEERLMAIEQRLETQE